MTEDELPNADFQAIEGSQSAHCCFEATVVDKNRPHKDGDGIPMDDYWHTVCECFSMEDAEMIAEALRLKQDIDKLKLGHSTGDR